MSEREWEEAAAEWERYRLGRLAAERRADRLAGLAAGVVSLLVVVGLPLVHWLCDGR